MLYFYAFLSVFWVDCPDKCTSCSGLDDCDGCVASPSAARVTGSEICRCPDGYYDNGVDDECV